MTTVLVVDDDPAMREGLSLALAGEFTVSTAVSAEDAYAQIARSRPETMVLDQNMPGMSGMGLLEKLVGRAPATVVLSGRADVKLARQAMHLGADNLLGKPFNLEQLKLSLHQAAERVRPIHHGEGNPLALRGALAMDEANAHGGTLEQQTQRYGRAMVAEAVSECRGDRVLAAQRLGLTVPELVGLEADFRQN